MYSCSVVTKRWSIIFLKKLNQMVLSSYHKTMLDFGSSGKTHLAHPYLLQYSSSYTAFVTYVRPILECASVIWSPYHLGEIAKLESVQGRFTKRFVGLRNITYADNNFFKLDSLEEQRLRFDIIFTYKILFGLVNMNCNDIFAVNDFTVTRGHSYILYAKTSRTNVRHNFFCNRVVNVWNRLPASDSHFKTFKSCKSFLAA